MTYSEIGKNIQAARKAQRLSREALAEKAGLSANFIGNIERGEKAVSLESFIKIANALGVSADLLLGDVIDNGYQVKTSVLCEQINSLPPERRKLAHKLLETILHEHD